jgi:G6PDH family F420-dependent oxidoreductase
MIKFGYKLMTEEHGPNDLVRYACAAEEAGFEILAASDHYHPWLESQGHSPYVWSVLGAVAQATESAEIMTAVTCPIIRYHPAIVAQAAATVALLSDGRFTLGLGSGEQLNEHVVGQPWPPADIRQEMLAEAIDAMRELWRGGMRSYRGLHVTVQDACVFDLPDEPPPVIVAVGGKQSARLAAERGDGMITTVTKKEWIDAWRNAGGEGPLYCEATICWARTREKAIDIAHERSKFGALGGFKVLSELPNVVNFEAAAKRVRKEDVAHDISCGPDPEEHVAAIKKYVDAGFDRVIIHQPGDDQEGFLRFWRDELAPQLKDIASEAA